MRMTFQFLGLCVASCIFGLFTSCSCAVNFGVTPLVAELYEFEENTVTLATASCSDDTTPAPSPAPAPFIVALGGVRPAAPCGSNCFNVYPTGGVGGSYELVYLPGQGALNYDQQTNYFVTLNCNDPNNLASNPVATQEVDIRLRPNTPPFFTMGSVVTTNINNAESVQAGQSIYRVGCNDDNLDSLTFSMTTIPSSNLFSIGLTDGIIRATGDLSAECRTQIAFEVTCQDPYHSPVGPVSIQATLQGANDQPTITGINTAVDKAEDIAVGSVLLPFTVTDKDATTCTLTTTPLDSLQYFQLGAQANTIEVKSTLDYEQINTRNTNITVTCTDGFCTSEKAYLYVRITDVNEPIELLPKDFSLTTDEGLISLDPGWITLDEDLNDFPTYTIIGGNTNGRFTIDPSSGRVSSTLEYDVDPNVRFDTDFLIVQVEDQGGHQSTSTVTITILDINDNRPVFNPQTMQFTIDDCASRIGVPIATVAATDDDSDYEGNNVLTYSGGNGPIIISSTGDIIPTSSISGGNTYVVSAQATDAGSPSLNAATPASVTVIVRDCPTTTTAAPTTTTTAAPTTTAAATTTAAPVTVGANTSDSLDENLGWIVIAGLLATVFLAALGLMLWKFCWPIVCATGKPTMYFDRLCGDCCQPRPKAVRPVRGQPPRPGNKTFWQERYPDDDYRDQPNRDRTPSPAPIEGGAPLALEPWRPRALQY